MVFYILDFISEIVLDWDPFVFLELFSDSQGSSELRDCLSRFDPCAEYCSAEFRAEYVEVLGSIVRTISLPVTQLTC